MKRLLSLCAAIAFSTSAHAADMMQQAEQPQFIEPDTSISLETKDIDLFLEGRIKQESYYLDKVATLRGDRNDTYNFFRNKIKLNAYAEYGRRRFGRPAAQGEFRLAAFNYWDEALKYTEFSEEGTYFDESDPYKKILLGEHKHEAVVPLTYLSKAWINVDFDVLFPKMTPTSFKIGYFRYKVGRGISLGSFFDGGLSYMGWTDYTCPSNATQSPPGMLLEIEFNEKCALELYYSRMRSRTTGPQSTRAATRAHRLDMDYLSEDPREIERGTKNDTEIFSAKGELDLNDTGGALWHFEPYIVAVNAPEQNLELTGDASSRFATTGMMLEWRKGQCSLNVEGAFQFGYQDVHAIDRNKHVFKVNDSVGSAVVTSYHDHIQVGANPLDNALAEGVLNEVVNLPGNRSVGRAGKEIVDTVGVNVTQGGKSLQNKDFPFGGLGRFRDSYRLNYGGYMGMIDVAYTTASRRATFSAAAAVISGDPYPYNTEKTKNYGGFVPLRDQNYFGKYVRSFAVLYARKMPRPVDMADHKFYAFNNAEDTSNLRYVGFGAQFHPLKDPRSLTIMPVWFSFWEDCAPMKWDKNAVRTFNKGAGVDGMYAGCQKKLGFTGAATGEQANSHLGHEFSLCVMWKPMDNCEIASAFSAFLPGQLYKDIDGTPNRNTRSHKPNADLIYESLGSEVVFGASTKISFKW